MSHDDPKKKTYVDTVRENTRQYVDSLLEELEKAKKALVAFDSEKSRLLQEKLTLQQQLLDAREELDRHRNEQSRLQYQLMDIEKQNQQFSEQHLIVEQQNTNLANLYVASYRLHGTVDREETLSAIKEIVINLVGCEEFGIYEISGDGHRLDLVGAMGIDEESLSGLPAEGGVIGEAVQAARVHVADGDPEGPVPLHERHLTACIPLTVAGRPFGAIVLYRLLPQKAALEALDLELFDLLATHAATALYLCRLHTEATTREQASLQKAP